MAETTPGYAAALAAAEHQAHIRDLANELLERNPDLVATSDTEPALARAQAALQKTRPPAVP